MNRHRSWTFTWWGNPTGTFPDNNMLYEQLVKTGKIKWICVGLEHSEEGELHHQGALNLTNPQSFEAVRKLLPPTSHIEVMHCSLETNRNYCSKESILFEWGILEPRGRKKRTAEDVKMDAINGGMRQIINLADTCQEIKMAEAVLKYCEPKRDWKPQVRWYWGQTGTGKTRTAREEFPDAWVSGKSLKWWYDYDRHQEVIIDDFRPEYCSFSELLRILDRYPYTVETKGGHRQLLANVIIITAPLDPLRLYEKFGGAFGEDIRQLLRRIDEIRPFNGLSDHNSEGCENYVSPANWHDIAYGKNSVHKTVQMPINASYIPVDRFQNSVQTKPCDPQRGLPATLLTPPLELHSTEGEGNTTALCPTENQCGSCRPLPRADNMSLESLKTDWEQIDDLIKEMCM